MNKKQATAIARQGVLCGDIKKMLISAYDDGAADERRSTVNSLFSKGAVFNILWKGTKDSDDNKVESFLAARNALREFGDYYDGYVPFTTEKKPDPPPVQHEDAINPHMK